MKPTTSARSMNGRKQTRRSKSNGQMKRLMINGHEVLRVLDTYDEYWFSCENFDKASSVKVPKNLFYECVSEGYVRFFNELSVRERPSELANKWFIPLEGVQWIERYIDTREKKQLIRSFLQKLKNGHLYLADSVKHGSQRRKRVVGTYSLNWDALGEREQRELVENSLDEYTKAMSLEAAGGIFLGLTRQDFEVYLTGKNIKFGKRNMWKVLKAVADSRRIYVRY